MEPVTEPLVREMPEKARLAAQALNRALKKAFLTGEAYDPDGSGYRYWKAIGDAEKTDSGTSNEK